MVDLITSSPKRDLPSLHRNASATGTLFRLRHASVESGGLEELTYPFHDGTFSVTQCGRICFKGQRVNLSQVFAGQNVGVTQVGERIWLVTFMRYDLGCFDDQTCRLELIENPFGPRVLSTRSE